MLFLVLTCSSHTKIDANGTVINLVSHVVWEVVVVVGGWMCRVESFEKTSSSKWNSTRNFFACQKFGACCCANALRCAKFRHELEEQSRCQRDRLITPSPALCLNAAHLEGACACMHTAASSYGSLPGRQHARCIPKALSIGNILKSVPIPTLPSATSV